MIKEHGQGLREAGAPISLLRKALYERVEAILARHAVKDVQMWRYRWE